MNNMWEHYIQEPELMRAKELDLELNIDTELVLDPFGQ